MKKSESELELVASAGPIQREKQRSHRRFSNWPTVVLALASSAALGVIAVSLVLAPSVPPDLDSAAPAPSFPIVMQEFDDAVPITVVFSVGDEVHLRAPIGGVVTRDDCVSGGLITSGQSPLAVNGDSVIALATSIPLWRQLARGDQGPDVAALQEELNRLGAGLAVDGVLGLATQRAVQALFEPVGASAVEPTVLLGRIFWLPAPEVRMQNCEFSIGDELEAGQSIASSPGALGAVSVTKNGSNSLPGDRLLSIDDVTVPLDEDGSVSSPESLRMLGAARSFVDALLTDARSFAGTVKLVDPVQVAAVPPGAIVGAQGQLGCAVSEGRVVGLTIVGSELGRSYVMFEGQPPSQIETRPELTSCD